MSLCIDLQPVKSSNVKAVGYHEPTRTLRVQFHNGSVYDYHDVPPNKHKDLMAADSVGRHLHRHIIGSHEHLKRESAV